MIKTVHEDDLAAWYRISEPVGDVSIDDFELDDCDDLPRESPGSFSWERDTPTQTGSRVWEKNRRESFSKRKDLDTHLETVVRGFRESH